MANVKGVAICISGGITMTSWSQMMTPGKGSFGDLEEKVDRGEITRWEADEEMERRFERAAGHEERYGLDGWPIDMKY